MKSKMTTQDLITMYKSQRYEAKLGQQLFAIPRRDDDMIQQQVFYYYCLLYTSDAADEH